MAGNASMVRQKQPITGIRRQMRLGPFHLLALGIAILASIEWLVFHAGRAGLLLLVLAAALALGQSLWRALRM